MAVSGINALFVVDIVDAVRVAGHGVFDEAKLCVERWANRVIADASALIRVTHLVCGAGAARPAAAIAAAELSAAVRGAAYASIGGADVVDSVGVAIIAARTERSVGSLIPPALSVVAGVLVDLGAGEVVVEGHAVLNRRPRRTLTRWARFTDDVGRVEGAE